MMEKGDKSVDKVGPDLPVDASGSSGQRAKETEEALGDSHAAPLRSGNALPPDQGLPRFLWSFCHLYEHYWPYLDQAAQQHHVLQTRPAILVEIQGVEGYVFDPLRGFLPALGASTVSLNQETFFRLFSPDLVRHNLASYVDIARPSVESGVVLRDLSVNDWLDFLSRWFMCHELASTAFFESQHGLVRYFSSPSTVSEWWTERRTESGPLRRYSDVIRHSLGSARGILLDVGAGHGRWAQELGPQASLVVIMDASSEMLLSAHRRLGRQGSVLPYSRFTYVKGDAAALPFASGSFDGILALQIFMHLPQLSGAIADLTRSLRKSGKIWMDFSCFRGLHDEDFRQKSPITRIYDESYLDAMISDHGIVVAEKREHYENDVLKWVLYTASI
jgi:ubiquinone/menaquinone biosynthesis C-methylase UbiE